MDVNCIQAGQAAITVRVSQGGNDLGEMTVSTDPESNSVTFDQYTLRLVGVEPDPVSTQTIDMSEYRVTMMVVAAAL